MRSIRAMLAVCARWLVVPAAAPLLVSCGAWDSKAPDALDARNTRSRLLATITVTPNPVSVAPGGSVTFTATGRDAAGRTVAIEVAWSVAAGGGTISAAGLYVAGRTPGTYAGAVRASSGGITGAATVTVTAGALATLTVAPNPDTVRAGATQAFTATGRDAAGNPVAVVPAWSVAAGGGTISGAGVFTAGATPGTFANTVWATAGEVTGRASVTVVAATPASVAVQPAAATLSVGATVQLAATVKDGSGAPLSGLAVTWASARPAIATVSAAGVVTAVAAGIDTVTATAGGVSGRAVVTVTAPAPSSGSLRVAVGGLSGPLASGGSAVAQRTDAAGAAITIAVSAAGSGGPVTVPTGTYSVSYTPPSGWRVTTADPLAGQAVAAGGSTTASFVAAASTGGYLTPDILNNASFEPGELTGLNGASVSGDGWSGFTGGTMADAVNGGVPWTPIPVYRVLAANETPSVAPAPSGNYVVEATLSTNTTVNGSNGPFRYFFGPGNLSELWVRFYFRLSADFHVNSFWKFAIFRLNGGNGGGLDLNTGGLNFYSSNDCNNNYRFFVPMSDIPLGQWNWIEYHYSRKDANPYAEFWFNGARVTHADGQWAGGPTCQWWTNNVLYIQRQSGAPGDAIGNGIGWAETINTGGTGKVYFDRISISTLGRIGP